MTVCPRLSRISRSRNLSEALVSLTSAVNTASVLSAGKARCGSVTTPARTMPFVTCVFGISETEVAAIVVAGPPVNSYCLIETPIVREAEGVLKDEATRISMYVPSKRAFRPGTRDGIVYSVDPGALAPLPTETNGHSDFGELFDGRWTIRVLKEVSWYGVTMILPAPPAPPA